MHLVLKSMGQCPIVLLGLRILSIERGAFQAGVPMAKDEFMAKNNLKNIRETMLLSKSELARKAGVSSLTIDRVEKGYSCRLDTKRKIIQGLGLKLADKGQVFKD